MAEMLVAPVEAVSLLIKQFEIVSWSLNAAYLVFVLLLSAFAVSLSYFVVFFLSLMAGFHFNTPKDF